MPMSKETMIQQYQHNAVAMGNAMRAARDVMDAESKSDLAPEHLLDVIDDVAAMLLVARYHAERMQVFARLIDSKVKDTQRT